MRLGRALVVCGVLFLFLPRPAASSDQRPNPSRSDVCGDCHRDIYRMWSVSAHAQAMEDPIFLGAFRETDRREGPEVTRICLGCHSPAVAMTNDFKLDLKTSWEGVSCDICHSISEVKMGERGPELRYDLGSVKRGPIRDAASGAHEVAYSELHMSALICAPCHEFKNGEGVPIMATYSEWQGSSAGKAGKSCQECHMSRAQAEVVDPRVARVPEAHVNLHEVPGGHSLTQLNKAVVVNLRPIRTDSELLLDVQLKNVGAGHSFPTGMPSRHVILEMKVRTNDGKSFEESRTYGRTFVDASGALIDHDSGYFAKGVKLTKDNRIASDEQRVETFRFPISNKVTAFVNLRLHYEHSPTGTDEGRTYLTFYTTERMVGPE
jgi:hypothetical protein